MCKRGDRGRFRAELARLAASGGLALLVICASIALAAPAGAQVTSPQLTGVEMTGQVRQTLKQLEEQWLEWVVQNDPVQADRSVNGLLDIARQLGMRRLPDLAAGAVARAVQAAQQKDFARAHWALA